jgi:hypothetical protein
MVMETVGKIEILLIIHSAQVLVFSSSSLGPSQDYLQGFFLLRFAFLFAFSFLLALRRRVQCIHRTHPTMYNNNTNNRSENIYVFTSETFTAKAGESFTCLSSSS